MTLAEVRDWVKDAVIDDWRAAPGQWGADLMKLERDGFSCLAVLRVQDPRLTVWAKDGLQIQVPVPYSWKGCLAALQLCDFCAVVGKTVRVGFAERGCPACEAERRAYTDFITSDFA